MFSVVFLESKKSEHIELSHDKEKFEPIYLKP